MAACEKLSLSATGGKQELAARLVQYYDRDSNMDFTPHTIDEDSDSNNISDSSSSDTDTDVIFNLT